MLRILVIDDERIILKMVEAAPTSMGHEVITANSGEDGLRRI